MTARPLKCQSKDTGIMLSEPSQKHSMWIVKLPLINRMNKPPYFAELYRLTVCTGFGGRTVAQIASVKASTLFVCNNRGRQNGKDSFSKMSDSWSPAEISPFSRSRSILIDKATFDNAACCHHDIWSPSFPPSPDSLLNRNITMRFNTGSIATLQWYIHSHNEYWWMKTNTCMGNLYSGQCVCNSRANEVSLRFFCLCFFLSLYPYNQIKDIRMI